MELKVIKKAHAFFFSKKITTISPQTKKKHTNSLKIKKESLNTIFFLC